LVGCNYIARSRGEVDAGIGHEIERIWVN
jgi:hypothetical protein